jgi:hypothetical protein
MDDDSFTPPYMGQNPDSNSHEIHRYIKLYDIVVEIILVNSSLKILLEVLT